MQLIRCRNKKPSRGGAHKGKKILSDFHARKPKKYKKQESLTITDTKPKAHFLCVGDYICLYSEDAQGYVYNCQSSTVHNAIQVYNNQDRDKPLGIPDTRAVVFKVCIQNRYKLNKKYRKLLGNGSGSLADDNDEALDHAKAAAAAEETDNVQEQKRNEGRRVRYGEAIQLKHLFTGKYIHTSTTQTSKVDKNNMRVSLEPYSSKHAQFRILPRYKVRSEGESVQILDQIVLENVKSPGNYLHASEPQRNDPADKQSELNMGIDMASFTVVRYCQSKEEHSSLILCGSAIRLFHKDLEAYLVAEGLFDDTLTETVHLRLREMDPMVPRTMYPSTSGITYWQIEDEHSILYGGPLSWGQQVRFRHMTTRHYLCSKSSAELYLTTDANDPKTVFRLHPLIKVSDDITIDSYARIEHVLTGSWLHGQRNEIYNRHYDDCGDEFNPMSNLQWDGAELRQIKASKDRMYHDAYTLQPVDADLSDSFIYVAGMVPFLLELIKERKSGQLMNAKRSSEIQKAVTELRDFVKVQGRPCKNRQKLLRNLRIVDLVVVLLRLDVQSEREESHMVDIFRACYDLLHTYMTGSSRKNSLYFAKYISFFQSQITGVIGLEVTETLIELLRDNRRIIERIPPHQMDAFIDLLEYEDYKYLDLLGVMCVCKDQPLHDNQLYITNTWLKDKQVGLFLTERGQNINKLSNVVYVSVDCGQNWTPLYEFVDASWYGYNEKQVLYLEHQLDLFEKLCFGRNEETIHSITLELGLLTWGEVFLCLQQDVLPDTIRAKYCQLVNELFINVGRNYSLFAHQHSCIVYDELDIKDPSMELDFMRTQIGTELDAIFPVLSDWIKAVLSANCVLVAANTGRNMLIKQVLQMLLYLASFGFYNSLDEMNKLIPILLDMLDGKTDRPFHIEKDKKKGIPKNVQKKIQYYTNTGRYEQDDLNNLIASIKIRLLRVLDLILTFQDRTRFRALTAVFKDSRESTIPDKQASVVLELSRDQYDPFAKDKKSQKQQKIVLKCLRQLFTATTMVDGSRLTPMLMDLLQYGCRTLNRKLLETLDNLYSSKTTMFQRSVNGLLYNVHCVEQILTTVDSVRVHRKLAYHLPRLKRYVKSKPTPTDTAQMAEAIESLMELFDTRCKPDSYEAMTHRIMLNHDVPSVIFDVLSQVAGNVPFSVYQGVEPVAQKAAMMLCLVCKNNPTVHKAILDNLGILIAARGVENHVASALAQVFSRNQSLCIQVQAHHIERLVQLACTHAECVPQYMTLLTVLVKPHPHQDPLKRNQTCVMKSFIQHFSKVAFPLDKTKSFGEQLLLDPENLAIVDYIVKLTDLLATCAEGENHYIESICQTVLNLEEVLSVLSDPLIHHSVKRPFVKFCHEVYIRSSINLWDSDIVELFNNSCVQTFLGMTVDDIRGLSDNIQRAVVSRSTVMEALQHEERVQFGITDDEKASQATVFFIFDAFLPFVETLFTKYQQMDGELNSRTSTQVNQLVDEVLNFSDIIRPCLMDSHHLKQLVSSVVALASLASEHCTVLQTFLYGVDEQVGTYLRSGREQISSKPGDDELNVNRAYRNLANNCMDMYLGDNTLDVQLNYTNKLVRYTEYSPVDGLMILPLGQEFQSHMHCFMTPSAKSVYKQYQLADRIIQHLGCAFHGMEDLDMKGLKLLRGMVHNEVVKLPDGWNEAPLKYSTQIQRVQDIQKTLIDLGIMPKVMPLLGSKSDRIFNETLAFLCTLLFNANMYIQEAVMTYFKSTKEEVFFAAIRSRLQAATCSIKERRSLRSHQKPRIKPASVRRPRSSHSNVQATTRRVLAQIDRLDNLCNATVQQDVTTDSNQTDAEKNHSNELLFTNPAHHDTLDPSEPSTDGDKPPHNAPKEISGEGSADCMSSDRCQIELVLKLLAMLCDGQYRDLQHYLCNQPDNLKSFNLISEVMALLAAVYSSIDEYTIDLAIQIYDTLIEFTSGSQTNRMVLLSNKIIDNINFILRSKKFGKSPQEKIDVLYQSIGNLLYALLEENGPEESIVGREVKDTIDKDGLVSRLTSAYRQADKPINKQNTNEMDQNISTKDEPSESEAELGFTYYLILMRLFDIDPNIANRVRLDEASLRAIDYYKENCLSVEIMKDSCLQKINFRIASKKILREEVKEKLKWNVNRTSPSSRIRDFMAWSKDILIDVRHQRRILSNKLATFLTGYWLSWNQAVIALSLIINILMLMTWDAPMALEHVPANYTVLPDALFDSKPVVHYVEYIGPVVLGLGILHNLMAFTVLLTYFIANHPTLPDVLKPFRKMCRKKTADVANVAHTSRLEVHLLSTGTLYFLLFFSMSVAGTVWSGYLFAFHLLHIVNINQLLGGVIKAVTKNGKSLLWVAVLGLVIFYLYSLVAFAFLRNIFDPREELYCATLWQCTVTVMRYGLIGDYEEKFYTHPLLSDFRHFGLLSLYQVSFFVFISTIGLNVIFGIIVDTFSEHRALKWAAEADMRDSCFICGRPCYDFEHSQHGFAGHVKSDHNMWAYVFFFVRLEDTKPNDYTALDLYVANKLKMGEFDFFPVNQAMCLSSIDDDNSETKIDQLLTCLMILVKRQMEKESEKKQDDMKLEQAEWHQRHRQRLLSSTSTRHGMRQRIRDVLSATQQTSPPPTNNDISDVFV